VNLNENMLITQAITHLAGAADTADIEGAIWDAQNYKDVLVLCNFGVITVTGVQGVLLQDGDASNLSDAATIAGTSVTVADDDDEKTVAITVHKLRKRYGRIHVDRATADAVVGGAMYVQTNGRKGPEASPAGTGMLSLTRVVGS